MDSRSTILRRYATALAIVAAVLLFRWSLTPVISGAIPFLPVYIAVTLAAFYCGVGPTVLAFVLTFLASDYLFTPSRRSVFAITTAKQAVNHALSVGWSVIAGVMVTYMRRKLDQAERDRRSLQAEVGEREKAQSMLQDKEKLLRRLIDVQESEKQTIGHDIHDGLLQYVIGGRMLLESFERGNLDAHQRDTLDSVIDYLSKGIDDAKQVVRGVRPTVLDDLGLPAAIHDLADHYREVGMHVECTIDRSLDGVAPSLQTTVYRITQEALANARKHSGSGRLLVALGRQGAELVLTIEDFGCGFDPKGAADTGFGLTGMAERARLAGGECRVVSKRGGGTKVVCRLPMVAPCGDTTGPTGA
jgi:signal transduction histidine kinase